MDTVKISNFIILGGAVRYLLHTGPKTPFYGDSVVNTNINTVSDYISEMDLAVTQNSYPLYKLKNLQTRILEANDPEYILTGLDAGELTKIMQELELILLNEANIKYVYQATDKNYPLNKLLFDVGSLFANDVFANLPQIAQNDFPEAGVCIAFERPTAAVFHLLRGTEAVLREYYCQIVRRMRVDPLLWGNMIKHLRDRKSNKPPKTLLDNLQNLKDNYRNPTQHPELIYNIGESQDLLGLCIDVVNRISDDLNNKFGSKTNNSTVNQAK